jgi:hypothetical protein
MRVIVNPEQGFDLSAQGDVARTGLIQICAALIGGQFQGCGKHRNFGVGRFVHGNSIIYPLIREIEAKRAKNLPESKLKMKKTCGYLEAWAGLGAAS